MLYRIISYNPRTKIAVGVASNLFTNSSKDERYQVSLLAQQYVEVGRCYSFTPKDEFVNSEFIRVELKYDRVTKSN